MPVATNASIADAYLELINEFPLRRIKTAAQHAKATRLVLRLSSPKTDRGTSDYLDVPIDLIADYEKRARQTLDASKVSVTDIVRHRIEERNMSVSALARLIEVPQSNLSEMLAGKRDWSKAAIRIDLDNSGVLKETDPIAGTTPSGHFTFAGLKSGTYIIRVIRPSGWSQTFPTNGFGQHITLSTDQTVAGILFGEIHGI